MEIRWDVFGFGSDGIKHSDISRIYNYLCFTPFRVNPIRNLPFLLRNLTDWSDPTIRVVRTALVKTRNRNSQKPAAITPVVYHPLSVNGHTAHTRLVAHPLPVPIGKLFDIRQPITNYSSWVNKLSFNQRSIIRRQPHILIIFDIK